MTDPLVGTSKILPGPRDFALLHERAMPQKDQLCGPFWGALALSAADHTVSQEEVALLAGTVLAQGDPTLWLPPGASPRADYTEQIPVAIDGASAGTSAPGVARAIVDLSESALAAVPIAGPWTSETVVSLFHAVAVAAPESVLIANIRTGHLWNSRPSARFLLDYLLGLPVEAPPSDWDCGHFVTIAGCIEGSGGSLIIVRDTYSQLGWGGYHLQPTGAVAAALERGDEYEGGVLCICEASVADPLSRRLVEKVFELRHWDNGSPIMVDVSRWKR